MKGKQVMNDLENGHCGAKSSTRRLVLDSSHSASPAPLQKIVGWVVLAGVSAGIGGFGLSMGLSSGYRRGDGVLSNPETLGLLAWQYLFPASLLLLFLATLAVLQHPKLNSVAKMSFVLLLLAGCLTTLFSGVIMSKQLLSCGIIFCAGTEAAAQDYPDDEGFAGFNGLMLTFFGLALTCSCATILSRLLWPEKQTSVSASMVSTAPARRRHRRILSASVLALLILPCCFLLTTILPNNVRSFQLTGDKRTMTEYMASMGSDKQDQRDTAFLRTMRLSVSDNLTLKIFPDTLMFYGCLEIIVLFALVAAWSPSFARVCSKRKPGGFSVGEVGVMVMLLMLTVSWTFYWGFQHLYHGGKYPQSTEVVARVFGQLAILFMSLALLPASRNSLWGEALGVDFEASLWAHRWLGALSLLMMVCHFLAYWVRFSELGLFPHDALNANTYYPAKLDDAGVPVLPLKPGNNYTIPLAEFVVYPGVILMGVLPLIRRKNYEAFRYAHWAFLAIIPVALLHANSGWYFLLGGIAFWVADASVRFVRVSQPCPVTSVRAYAAGAGVTEVRFEMEFQEPGMYCFINVPQISSCQWHPFSLASSPLDGWAQLNIKNMGSGTWTGDLYELVASVDSKASASIDSTGAPFTLNVDGPYGPALDLDGHDSLVLIAGGIGITAIHSILAYMLHLGELGQLPPSFRRIRVVWASPDRKLFSMFSETLSRAAASAHVKCTVTLHSTERASDGSYADTSCVGDGRLTKMPVEQGRPNFKDILNEMHEDGATNAMLKICGPEAMERSVAAAARECDWVSYESHLFTM